MVTEIKFEYPVRIDVDDCAETFELSFRKYEKDGEWKLLDTDADQFYIHADAFFQAVDDAYRILNEIYKLQ